MGIKADDAGIDISGATAAVTKIMASDPRRIARIEVVIQMPKDKTYGEDEKQLLKSAGLNCPVCKSLSENLEKDVSFFW
jgi:organic hydroperoxide reductase OsmC/OhrA